VPIAPAALMKVNTWDRVYRCWLLLAKWAKGEYGEEV
jgi:hypothetical protein